MALRHLGPVLFGENPAVVINFLKARGLLHSVQDCPVCNIPRDWKKRAVSTDGFIWRCPECHAYKSLRNGPFFEKSKKLSLKTCLQLLHHWCMDMPVTKAAKQANISEKRCIDVYQWFQDVCTTKLLSTSIILGGPGIVVQVDESLFTHSPKVT